MLAMVLAGGRGEGMGSLCQERPAAVLPFAGQNRVIDFSLSNCVHSGIGDIAVLADYQRSAVGSYLRRWSSANALWGQFDLLEPPGGPYVSASDAVYQNLDYVDKSGADAVLVLPADHVYKMDYRQMLVFHQCVKADLTVAVMSVPLERAYRFGNVVVDAEDRVGEYVENPGIPRGNLVSMGVYLFDREVLVQRLVEDAARLDSPHDFGRTVIPSMVGRGDRVFAYRFTGYWQDIGTVGAYHSANMALTRRVPSFRLDNSWPILTEANDHQLPRRSEQGSAKSSLISPGCMIKGQVENSVLSPGVWVDSQAVVRNSVLMANTFIGHRSVVDYCILDEKVSVGRFCFVGFGAARIPLESEVTVLGRGATVPPHTAIGRSCEVLPNVEPSDFGSSAVHAGTMVSRRMAAAASGGQRP